MPKLENSDLDGVNLDRGYAIYRSARRGYTVIFKSPGHSVHFLDDGIGDSECNRCDELSSRVAHQPECASKPAVAVDHYADAGYDSDWSGCRYCGGRIYYVAAGSPDL
ncbi:MAG: hypothetical protein PUF98_09625 [Oscillibacter sp.]|nr:hypothetical protein [Oscillibacter sp.]MDD7221527.1 hypothetical protein [Eubacteriales bacterium]MDY2618885.1 hypothetical protein [Oscillospiraceae bacterium]